MWIYVVGEKTGRDIKIGHTKQQIVRKRLNGVDREANDDTYVLLAAARSDIGAERLSRKWWSDRGFGFKKGGRTEYFKPEPELIGWILWLRTQPWVSFSDLDPHDHAYEIHPDEFIPKAGRSLDPPATDPDVLIQPHEQLQGPLAGTAWAFMPDALMSFQDYFTEPEIVAAAIEAMGGCDLDAASHWLAQKRLWEHEVRIPDFLHRNRSAFDHPWADRVWLNPPYGNNAPWFARALEMIEAGVTTQLCMLSPAYVFITKTAQVAMQQAAAAVLLSPTPEFLNPGDPTATGTNLPHLVVYWGHRIDEFLDAYAPHGIPIIVASSRVS